VNGTDLKNQEEKDESHAEQHEFNTFEQEFSGRHCDSFGQQLAAAFIIIEECPGHALGQGWRTLA
jgi:hypothetical protein